MKIHELKTVEPYFRYVSSGVKTFEVRKNDRDFQVGDLLHLREYITKSVGSPFYSGHEVLVKITYILNDKQFVKDGFVILGIEVICKQSAADNKRV